MRRWFTSLLLHKSFMQLLASVSVLLLVSFALEYRYNTVNLALISTVAGVCANFFAAAVSSPSAIICGPVAILSCHLGERPPWDRANSNPLVFCNQMSSI